MALAHFAPSHKLFGGCNGLFGFRSILNTGRSRNAKPGLGFQSVLSAPRSMYRLRWKPEGYWRKQTRQSPVCSWSGVHGACIQTLASFAVLKGIELDNCFIGMERTPERGLSQQDAHIRCMRVTSKQSFMSTAPGGRVAYFLV